MSYAAAVDHLYARGLELAPDPSAPSGARRKFDLEHMRTLARALGNPQSRFPSVLIAGTNGKGSTAATLASILTTAGYRTALYTSPHLSRVNERIQIDGHPISDDDFARLYFQVDSAAERLIASGELPHHPSFFETLTALAFLYFAGTERETGIEHQKADSATRSSRSIEEEWNHPLYQAQNLVIPTEGSKAAAVEGSASLQQSPVEIAILEVGLGGRLDATNIVDPLFSIITDISLDHQDYLGNTIAEITREKAGILRPGGTLITLPQHPEANQAIGEVAVELGIHAINAAGYLPTTDKLLRNTEAAPAASLTNLLPRNRYTLTVGGHPLHVDSPLWGQHQQRNLALTIAAVEELRNPISYNLDKSNRISYKIDNSQIESGIRNTLWPGRLELIAASKSPTGAQDSAPILLDVAHNPAGAWTLRAALAQLPEDLPRTLLFSCLRDKDLREMSQILLPLFDSASPDRPNDHILFAPINSPRASSLDDLVEAAHALDIPAETNSTLAEALARAQAITPANGLIVATGSVYLIGELRSLLLHQAPAAKT